VSRVPVRVVVGAAAAPEGWAALRPRACPCCVGRVQMQVELARLIREQRPRGVQIELADASHLPALRRALAQWPLSDHVAL
jgi:hypothetical protein